MMFKESRLEATETHTRQIRPDVAAVDVHWEMSGARDPSGNRWPSRRGLMSLLVTREEGDWAIAVMHNMELPSDGMAAAQAQLQERRQQADAVAADES
jgi:hypothetical protein